MQKGRNYTYSQQSARLILTLSKYDPIDVEFHNDMKDIL